MNNQTKSILSLLLLLSTQANSNGLITNSQLEENKIDQAVVYQLLASEILSQTNIPDQFTVDSLKIKNILSYSEDIELHHFLNWLQSISGEKTKIQLRNPKDMPLATQDIKG